MKEFLDDLHNFHEVLQEQRCGNREKYEKYLKCTFSMFLGYCLGHALGFFLF